MKERTFVLIILLYFITAAFSQELRLVVYDKPLNTVLNSLNVEISFDDKALAGYKISASSTFQSPEEAIEYLLKNTPFRVERLGSVYVISPVPEEESAMKNPVGKRYVVSGVLSDKSTGELLPYAYVQTDRGAVSANETGYFSFVNDVNVPMRIRVRYMGFEMLDTMLSVGNHKLSLMPETIILEEVVVSPVLLTMYLQTGNTSGEARVNHQVARYMPGSADNSVFNLLRMMPGVRASGEPSEELVVWGSNWGESRLVYDGFTIYGMKSFNDQIGSVNPYLAKDIRLLKGVYDASQGNRIGAVTEITGNDGSFTIPSVKANLSNYTANLYASLPIKSTSAFSVAYRQTFYNLYSNESVDRAEGKKYGKQSTPDIYIEPEYDFRDLNLKYAGKFSENDHYYISMYGADEHFEFNVRRQELEVDAVEKNRQYGLATGYNRSWNSGSSTKFLFAYSKYSATIDNVLGITNEQPTSFDVFNIKNTVQEYSLNLEQSVNVGQHHKVKLGVDWKRYENSFNDENNSMDNPALYVIDNVLLRKLSLNAGVRTDFITGDGIYIQPRVAARYAFSDELTATASAGLYKQFLARVPYQYNSGSYQMIWSLSDTIALSSTHVVAGLSYNRNGWQLSAEGYMKKNRNQQYYLDNVIYALNNTNLGLDFFVKKKWYGQTFFCSYSIVGSTKPQKTTGREIKLGTVCSFKPFHVSATYIYGTGFPYLSTGGHEHGAEEGEGHENVHKHSDISGKSYSRLDLSLVYKLQLSKIRMQAGASLLNVFNANNVKYSYRLSDKSNVFNIYTKATSFTPITFLEVVF